MAAGEVVHIAGTDVQIGPRRRQRCAWCGATLLDDDLSRMAVQLPADGSDPKPPGAWPVGAFVGVVGESRGSALSGFSGGWVVDAEEHPDGTLIVPDGCCAKLDPEMTA